MHENLVTFGSGNVFADLGVPNAEEHLAKSRLVAKITDVIRNRGLTQAEAADLTGVAQPKISGLMRGQFRDFSSDRLCRMLNKLGVGVELVLVDQPDWQPGSTNVYEQEEATSSEAPAMAM